MKSILFLSGFISLIFCACFSVGSGSLPSATEGFVPKKNYEKSFDSLWNSVNSVLLAERINISSQDKENKKMTTDYIQGTTQVGLGGSLNTRYKYNITFIPEGNNTAINVIASLESSSKSIDWHDISKDNGDMVTNLENYLYEKIEITFNK